MILKYLFLGVGAVLPPDLLPCVTSLLYEYIYRIEPPKDGSPWPPFNFAHKSLQIV